MLGVPVYVAAVSAIVVFSLTVAARLLAERPEPKIEPDPIAGLVPDQRAAQLQVGPLDRVIVPAVKALGKGVRRISPAGRVEKLERRIRLAGSPRGLTLERTLAAKLVLGVGGLIGGLQWSGGAVTARAVLAGAGLGLLGYLLPDLHLRGKSKERQDRIRLELPDSLDQLTISVEAGLAFDAALARIADSGTGPLAEELRRVLAEIRVGVLRADALRHLLERTDVQELRQFVLALQHAEEFGLPVAKVLRVQAAELRVKRRQRAEEQAMKIPVKIVFPLVVCIFPALFIVLLGPAVIRVIDAFS